MMILFTHGKKILGVKGSKPNFTSRDDVFFPTRLTTISPNSYYYIPKGIKRA